MKSAFYVLTIVGGTDPEMAGPFRDENERDAAAKIINDNTLEEEDSIFRLDMDMNGRPFVHPFLQGEFE